MNKLSYILLMLVLFASCKQPDNKKVETSPVDTLLEEKTIQKTKKKEEPLISEKITIEEYEQKTVMSISDTNSYLVKEAFYPVFNLRANFVKRYFWQYSKYSDTTNSKKEYCYALFEKDGEFFIDSVITYRTMVEIEGCNETHEVNIYDSEYKIFLLIDTVSRLKVGKIDYLPFKQYEYQVKPSQRLKISDDNGVTILDYSATLCEGTFQYQGLGTIRPTFFNISLKLTDSLRNISQDLFLSAHQHRALLHDIWIGDINRDKIQDYILTFFAGDVCEYRALYLSNPTGSKIVDFKGNYEMCDCP